MPSYHVYVHWGDELGARFGEEMNFSDEQLDELVKTIKKGDPFLLKGIKIKPQNITKLEIWTTSEALQGRTKTWEWIALNGVDVTKNFIIALPQKIGAVSSHEIEKFDSKNVFIVHGHDLEPVKQLKEMLKEFGLNPIVLHEKASGGRTLAEKLEKYAENVGFAFVILTPDDVGCIEEEYSWIFQCIDFEKYEELKKNLPSIFKPRARQNVIFEMGYFWGLLKRKRVCCLLKEDVEKPSDIEGIVYISFKSSVNECHDMIIKELKEAGYLANSL